MFSLFTDRSFHRLNVRMKIQMEGRKCYIICFVCKQRREKKKLKIVEARIEQFSRLDAIELVVSLVKLLQPMIFRFIKL